MWDDLIENLWRHVVAVGVVLVAVAVGFSRLVYSTCQGVKKTNFWACLSDRLLLALKYSSHKTTSVTSLYNHLMKLLN